jgi:hypothetical protein
MRERTEIISSGRETAVSTRSAGCPATKLPTGHDHFGRGEEDHHIIMISLWPDFVRVIAV